MNDFINKWKVKFRPDLKFPMHIKKRIYKIYRQRLFIDIEKEIEKEICKKLKNNNYFNNFASIKEVSNL